jgi:hypothetical protein
MRVLFGLARLNCCAIKHNKFENMQILLEVGCAALICGEDGANQEHPQLRDFIKATS